MNDSLRTNVFVRYHPEAIACACIHLAARQLAVSTSFIPHSDKFHPTFIRIFILGEFYSTF